MRDFLARWSFDWLTLTIPNGTNGKGSRSEGLAGEVEAREAETRLCKWAVTQGLHAQRIGKGSDGFMAGARFGLDPLAGERLATIRTGHATNMPSLELPGGDGACADLAIAALDQLGPVLMARSDVSIDISRPGLLDDLLAYARAHSGAGMAPPRVIESGTGRTIYWGKGEASARIYQKDLERVAGGKLDARDADPDLTRVEVTLRPVKGRKAGLARIAHEQGPGALLGTVHWVRELVRHVAAITDHARETDMAVTRVETTPDPRTAEDRAMHGAHQYAKTFCAAAAARIVARDHGGDWLAADVDPAMVEAEAVAMVAGVISETYAAHDVSSWLGLDAVRRGDEEAARIAVELDEWMRRQKRETARAQDRLSRALSGVLASREDRAA